MLHMKQLELSYRLSLARGPALLYCSCDCWAHILILQMSLWVQQHESQMLWDKSSTQIAEQVSLNAMVLA